MISKQRDEYFKHWTSWKKSKGEEESNEIGFRYENDAEYREWYDLNIKQSKARQDSGR